MQFPATLSVSGPNPNLSFRIQLLQNGNKDVVNVILSYLPFSSFLLHVVVAGETIYTPFPTLDSTTKNMVPRKRGSVYYNTTSQSICFCYGTVTESTLVNEFARVVDEDLEALERLGRVVYEQTIQSKDKKIVKIGLQILGSKLQSTIPETIPTLNGTPDPNPSNLKDWKSAKHFIDTQTAQLRHPIEPPEIKKLRLGCVTARAGQDPAIFQSLIFLQGFLSTLGPHIFSRLLTISTYPEATLPLMVKQTRTFLLDTFNHFEFLGDLGLSRVKEAGIRYEGVLDGLSTLEEWREVTDAMRTLIQILYRWVHLVFPWYLKGGFVGRSEGEVEALPGLGVYDGEKEG